MPKNSSVPADVILSHIVYRDVAAAMAWLNQAFGFEVHYTYGEPGNPQGAQMHLGEAWIMLRGASVAFLAPPARCRAR